VPIINVSGPSLDAEQKRQMARGLTEVPAKVYRRPPQHIIVIIDENPPENVSIGGTLVADRRAT
jgi:4-oxalocrotonate tautomerase